ncbi:hypothetical protein N0V86_009642 [Didymella sp. IMI 355093]|nr:hypothetical protein N0V86_009642 [Didymella sp. IMI 355093]
MPSNQESEAGKDHGRHGDIKPANILWFRKDPNDSNPHSKGILKISDFGFADFHGPKSKSNVPSNDIMGLTDGYRAPELDVTKRVSPRYDIWSFGCVLLEFMVWRMLEGEDGVEGFSVQRKEESTAIIQEDNFFNLRETPDEGLEALAKRSVMRMFDTLITHSKRTAFTQDMSTM